MRGKFKTFEKFESEFSGSCEFDMLFLQKERVEKKVLTTFSSFK